MGDPERTSPQFVSDGSPMSAAWDASLAITRTGIDHPSLLTDAHGRHFTLINHPTRAVTSSTWDGQVDDFRFAPHRQKTDRRDPWFFVRACRQQQ